jgi:ABC-type transport system involved in multi-copper enzyme maturation permease subunit
MFRLIVFHELKNIISSPRFNASFLTCAVLILLSVLAGIKHYNDSVKQYETVISLTKQEMLGQRDWLGLTEKAVRKPDPLQIFSSGITDDIGRYSVVSGQSPVKLAHSVFSDDLVYSLFRFIDFSFIAVVALSLFALLFTYDIINGEAERGTLQLVFSNPVPRAKYIFAKITGAWLGLAIPLAVPLLISILLLLIFSAPMDASHWGRLLALFGSALLIFTFFAALGAFTSALTKRSNVSFLVSLVCWVCFVFIIPRAGVIAAGHIVKVPGEAEIESVKEANAKNLREKYFEGSMKRWGERNKEMAGMSNEERSAYRERHNDKWMEEEENERKLNDVEIDKYNARITENVRNKKAALQKLAFTLSCLSPVSAFQIAAMNIAGTDVELKTRFENAVENYKKEFSKYIEKKRKENGAIGGIRIAISSDGGLKIDADRNIGSLNIADMPKFVSPEVDMGDALKTFIVNAGFILFSIIAALGMACVAFIKYDVR